jgi:TonB family protein
MTLLLDSAIRCSIVLVAGLATAWLLRHRSAALRHWVLAAAVFSAAAVVPLALIVPPLDLPPGTFSFAAMRSEAEGSNLTAIASAAGAPEPGTNVASGTDSGNSRDRRIGASALVATVWAAGVIAAAALVLVGVGRLVRITARAERVHHGPWSRVAAQVAGIYGLRRPVTVLQTDEPDIVATWGFLRPCVLLPPRARDWSEARARAVLCHELAHVRRHDWLVLMSAEALRIVFWFNPLVWLTCAWLRRESEQACDDAVLDAGVPAHEYAAHLLDVARSCRRARTPWVAAAVPMARPSTLEGRITAMLNPRLDRVTPSRRAIALTVLLLASIALPAAALRGAQGGPLPLKGSVYDPTGAVLPGVDLTLESSTEIKWQATTDASGRFEFPPVDAGRYTLTAAVPGFSKLSNELELTAAKDWERTITLQVGQVMETIHVSERRVPKPSGAPPQVMASTPIRIGGNIRPPRKLHNVNPTYPQKMRDAGLEGVVPLEATIGRDGTVQFTRVLTAQVHPDFAHAAIEAVRQWRFDPTLLNGAPVEVVMAVKVEFRLSD